MVVGVLVATVTSDTTVTLRAATSTPTSLATTPLTLTNTLLMAEGRVVPAGKVMK
jgi:hypothetical protein